MPSVPSIDRQKTSTIFRSVEHSHVQEALPVVEDRLREVLLGEETLPDVSFLATLLGRVQADGTRRLTVADNAHDEEIANDDEPRQRRDEVGERVRRKLVEVRRIADGLFGPQRTAKVLGTSGPAAPVTEGERLWRQAKDTIRRLEAPDFTVPVMTTSSLQFDPAQLASELRIDNDAFREALDAVVLEQRKAETTLAAKKARQAEAERIDTACARIYEGFFLLADRGDLFERFRRALSRLKRRRASSTEDPSEDGESPEDGEPSEGEPSEVASSEVASSED